MQSCIGANYFAQDACLENESRVAQKSKPLTKHH